MLFRALVVDDLGVLRDAPGRAPDDAGVASLVRAARTAGLRTAVLTNAEQVDPVLLGLVDVVLASGVTGLRKPDPRAFLDAAAALRVPAAACVVVDDAAVNVRGAVAAGMTGVLHRSVEETAVELGVLLAPAPGAP